jgi:hypothetical protein
MEGIPSEGVTARRVITMKLSTESIVAAAVAVVFAVLSLGAIAREQGEHAPGGPNAYVVATSAATLSEVTAGEKNILGFY